jgi:hypothetical protein
MKPCIVRISGHTSVQCDGRNNAPILITVNELTILSPAMPFTSVLDPYIQCKDPKPALLATYVSGSGSRPFHDKTYIFGYIQNHFSFHFIFLLILEFLNSLKKMKKLEINFTPNYKIQKTF